MSRIDEGTIASMIEPLVIIKANEENQHVQIKVTPFNHTNTDKEILSFADKIQYYRTKVRQSILGESDVTDSDVAANTTVTMLHIIDYYDLIDGISDEFNEFVDGLNNGGDTGGFDNDITGFFGKYFLDLNTDSLAELTAAINA